MNEQGVVRINLYKEFIALIRERQMSHNITYLWNLMNKSIDQQNKRPETGRHETD